MAGSINKANQRQHSKRAGYYKSQPDRTKVNKVVTLARHIARYGDMKSLDKLKQIVALVRHHAFLKTPSPRIKAVILSAAK